MILQYKGESPDSPYVHCFTDRKKAKQMFNSLVEEDKASGVAEDIDYDTDRPEEDYFIEESDTFYGCNYYPNDSWVRINLDAITLNQKEA